MISEETQKLRDEAFALNDKCKKLKEELNQLVLETCAMNIGLSGNTCPYCHQPFNSSEVLSVINNPIKWKEPEDIQNKNYVPRSWRNLLENTDIVDDIRLKCPHCNKDMLSYEDKYKKIKPKAEELENAVAEFYAAYMDYIDA